MDSIISHSSSVFFVISIILTLTAPITAATIKMSLSFPLPHFDRSSLSNPKQLISQLFTLKSPTPQTPPRPQNQAKTNITLLLIFPRLHCILAMMEATLSLSALELRRKPSFSSSTSAAASPGSHAVPIAINQWISLFLCQNFHPRRSFYPATTRNVVGFLVTTLEGYDPGSGRIARFNRSSQSLPSQLGVKIFAYCLISRQLDNPDVSSTMWFETESGSGDTKTPGLSYTPLNKSQVTSIPVLKELNYVKLRRILVGNKDVKVPYRYLVPGPDGNFGGTVVDLLLDYTFMEKPVIELVSQEFVKQMRNYSNARVHWNMFDPCFRVPYNESIHVPELVFEFKGGAKMKLPTANYFSFVNVHADVACLMIVTTNSDADFDHFEPAIILGNFQQQNYYVEFDLANDRFGFAERSCL
ncbi:Peptidase A1 [Corchorus capsularis]|uniref:Peptidase A1 n=1 Tax=Corchorus capsularis TaxID=210143 RepID=A0A1R3IIZ5_COCAP|nr:Peptidase A1 [Corchorus capsularis]